MPQIILHTCHFKGEIRVSKNTKTNSWISMMERKLIYCTHTYKYIIYMLIKRNRIYLLFSLPILNQICLLYMYVKVQPWLNSASENEMCCKLKYHIQ